MGSLTTGVLTLFISDYLYGSSISGYSHCCCYTVSVRPILGSLMCAKIMCRLRIGYHMMLIALERDCENSGIDMLLFDGWKMG
jgi:hypothetical protein